MRNILVFPDKTESDIMYPKDRDLEVGSKLEVSFHDNSTQQVEIVKIQFKKKKIYYHLQFVS